MTDDAPRFPGEFFLPDLPKEAVCLKKNPHCIWLRGVYNEIPQSKHTLIFRTLTKKIRKCSEHTGEIANPLIREATKFDLWQKSTPDDSSHIRMAHFFRQVRFLFSEYIGRRKRQDISRVMP